MIHTLSTNRTILEGTLIEPPKIRFTPAGRPVASLHLEHLSEGFDSTSTQRIELRILVIALGELADQCRHLNQGTPLHVEGSLNQKRWIRDGKVRWGKTELMAHTIKSMDQHTLSQSQA